MKRTLDNLTSEEDGRSIARYLMESTWRLGDAFKNKKYFDCIVHCHVPKTAGVSFYEPFKAHFKSFHVDHKDIPGSIRSYFGDVRDKKCQFYTGHFSTYEILDHIPEERIVVACVIRDPIDRLVSHYNYNSSPAHTWYEDFRRRFPDFESFWRSEQFGGSPMSRQLFGGLTMDGGLLRSPGGKPVEFAFAPQNRMNGFIQQLFDAMDAKIEVRASRQNVTGEDAKIISRSDLSEAEIDAISEEHRFDCAFYNTIVRTESTLNAFRRLRVAQSA